MNLLSNRVNKILIVFIACLFIFASVADAKKRQPVTATSWLVADGNGKIIKSVNHDDLHSIASITKLMTAMVVLDANQDLNERIEKFTRRQHLQLALIKSNNHSADLLCENYPGGTDACVDAMNAKAIKIGMKDTSFVDGSGINDDNVSTSRSLVKLVLAAQHYPLIVKSSQTSLMKIKLKNTYLSFKNTNPLVGKHQKFLVSKTGYIKVAGGCIALLMETDKGKRAIIILGSKNTHTRIPEVRHLVRNY
jgi:D-alanyl-D-alanine endopeptidase (penicillin-binding protein 7)